MNHLENYLIHLAAERGLSRHTILAYRQDIESFAALIPTSFPHVTKDDLLHFLTHLQSKGYKSSTICRMAISIRLFFRFLRSEGVLAKDLAADLESPKAWQTVPDVLSYDEVEALFASITHPRDRAIVELLYAGGIRVSELCTLNLLDIDEHQMKIKGKGGKERLVPLPKRSLPIVEHYLETRGELLEDNPPLFVSHRGKRIDRITIFHLIKAAATRAGLTKNVSPHTLRHSCATHLLENGADIRVIQEILGHAHIATTDRYTHISRSHLKSALDMFHPRS